MSAAMEPSTAMTPSEAVTESSNSATSTIASTSKLSEGFRNFQERFQKSAETISSSLERTAEAPLLPPDETLQQHMTVILKKRLSGLSVKQFYDSI